MSEQEPKHIPGQDLSAEQPLIAHPEAIDVHPHEAQEAGRAALVGSEIGTDASPEAFEANEQLNLRKILTDPDADPDQKKEVIGLVRIWGHVEHAREINAVWEEGTIKQRVRSLGEVLPHVSRDAFEATSTAERLHTGLGKISQALQARDMMAAGELSRQYQPGQAVETIQALTVNVVGNETIQQTSRAIANEAEETDDMLRRTNPAQDNMNPSDESLDKLTLELEAANGDIGGLRSYLEDELKNDTGMDWRKKYHLIQEMTTFAKMASNEDGIQLVRKLSHDFVQLDHAMRVPDSYSSPAALEEFRSRTLMPFLQTFDVVRRFTLLTQTYREEIK